MTNHPVDIAHQKAASEQDAAQAQRRAQMKRDAAILARHKAANGGVKLPEHLNASQRALLLALASDVDYSPRRR